MSLAGNTVLVTGGATGIGLAITERYLKAGSQLLICGRREDRLQEVKKKHPGVRTFVCDVGKGADRIKLYEWATRECPNLNVLVNNAGIQRHLELGAQEDWHKTEEEIAINLHAPIHLARLFTPHLLKQKSPAIVNVTSGLAFSPLARVPVYSATKAALRSFTLSLRHQLKGTPIKVVEIIPPAVNTDLGGVGLHDFGVNLDEFADSVMARVDRGDLEVPFGMSEKSSQASRADLDKVFAMMNQ